MSKTLGNLALICQKWSLKLLLLKSGGTRAVQKGAKKALPLIITNSKAKNKGAHFEHLNYHLLSILIVVYHDLLSDAKVLEDIVQCLLATYLSASDFAQFFQNHLQIFGDDVAAHTHFHRLQYSGEGIMGTE